MADNIGEIVIFGDSLSDTGNFIAAGLAKGALRLGDVTSMIPAKSENTPFWKPQSFAFRFTDGWAWPDYLWYHLVLLGCGNQDRFFEPYDRYHILGANFEDPTNSFSQSFSESPLTRTLSTHSIYSNRSSFDGLSDTLDRTDSMSSSLSNSQLRSPRTLSPNMTTPRRAASQSRSPRGISSPRAQMPIFNPKFVVNDHFGVKLSDEKFRKTNYKLYLPIISHRCCNQIYMPTLNAFLCQLQPGNFNYTVPFHIKGIVNYAVGGSLITNQNNLSGMRYFASFFVQDSVNVAATESNVLPILDQQIYQYHNHKKWNFPNFKGYGAKTLNPFSKLLLYWAGANDLLTIFGAGDKRGLINAWLDAAQHKFAVEHIDFRINTTLQQITNLWQTGDFSRIIVFNLPTVHLAPELNLFYEGDDRRLLPGIQEIVDYFNTHLAQRLFNLTQTLPNCVFSTNCIIQERGIVLLDVYGYMLNGLQNSSSQAYALFKKKTGNRAPATLVNLKTENPDNNKIAPIISDQINKLISKGVIDENQRLQHGRNMMDNKNYFVFWDGLHPSSVVHNMIGEVIFDMLLKAHTEDKYLDLSGLLNELKENISRDPAVDPFINYTVLNSGMNYSQRQEKIWDSSQLRYFWATGWDPRAAPQARNVWHYDDGKLTNCECCKQPFSANRAWGFNWARSGRHHCRLCGFIICESCQQETLIANVDQSKIQTICDADGDKRISDIARTKTITTCPKCRAAYTF